MPSLGHFGEYDEYLRLLAEAQRYKLRVNQHKGFLGDLPPEKLIEFLKGEIIELEDAAARGSKIEMLLEAADIANFALGFVIAALQKTEKPSQEPVVTINRHDEVPEPADEAPAFIKRDIDARCVPRWPDPQPQNSDAFANHPFASGGFDERDVGK